MCAKRYVIIGAGAAGLSLCDALLERGITNEIVVVDRKAAFTNDRTWCFWDTPHPFRGLAAHCWPRWDVVQGDGQVASQTSVRGGYACLRGADFYAAVCERIQRFSNVTLALGSAIEDFYEEADHMVVTSTSGAAWVADYVFDSRPRPLLPGGLSFSQRFFGQFVRASAPVFDPLRCTLMDFRVSQEQGLHFQYVLPFSATEALVENTYIQPVSADKITPDFHRQEISAYLADAYSLHSFEVQREEAGAIPMTTQPFPKREGRVFFIGTAGGCSKPSSGYTFTRIQEQCRQIAGAVQSDTLDTFQEKPAPWRYRFFDTVFLQALQDHPDAFPGYFHRLFSRVPPDALTAFLSETSTWPSDLQILRSLPLRPFLTAALRAAPHLMPKRQSKPFASG